MLWDSSAIVASLDADDRDHAKAAAVARTLGGERRPAFITNYIAAETHALLVREVGRVLAREWLFSRTMTIIRATPADEERAREILARHQDKDWSLCDAISFAVMDARRMTTAFSFDHHFAQYGKFVVLGLK